MSQSSFRRLLKFYGLALILVGCATAAFRFARVLIDPGQASLLYLPVVIGCAIFFGFGPSVAAALAGFLCWDYFFLPPYRTLTVANPKDWLSLFVFLVAAVTTARLASNAREQAEQAKEREKEIAILFQASETLSREVSLPQVIGALSEQLRALCGVSESIVWRAHPYLKGMTRISPPMRPPQHDENRSSIILAEAAARNRQVIGFDPGSRAIWGKAAGRSNGLESAYIPLQIGSRVVGVLEIGPRGDGKPFSTLDQRLALTLANHLAAVLAREALAEQAAQAEALREADAMKDSLLSMVSHELRSPLAAIKATAEGMALSLPQSMITAADDIRVINDEANRLNDIVGNLLDLSRLEGGAWQPERDWCDMSEIVATALDRLPDEDARRVKVSISGDAPLVRADYTQIALVVTNLLQNAMKYTTSDYPVELDSFRSRKVGGVNQEQAFLTVRVRDFGAGIAPGDELLIFTRFYRSAVHQKSTVHGTGLGLALCEAVVKAHGGGIWASNAPVDEPSGAVFSFTLPVDPNPIAEHSA